MSKSLLHKVIYTGAALAGSAKNVVQELFEMEATSVEQEGNRVLDTFVNKFLSTQIKDFSSSSIDTLDTTLNLFSDVRSSKYEILAQKLSDLEARTDRLSDDIHYK